MTQIKAIGSFIVLTMLCRSAAGDELAISPSTMIEMPPLVRRPLESQLYGAVGTSGINAVLVWAKGLATKRIYFSRTWMPPADQ